MALDHKPRRDSLSYWEHAIHKLLFQSLTLEDSIRLLTNSSDTPNRKIQSNTLPYGHKKRERYAIGDTVSLPFFVTGFCEGPGPVR